MVKKYFKVTLFYNNGITYYFIHPLSKEARGYGDKSLKGFLCYKECDIKKTHDIDFLLSECAEFDPIFRSIQTNNINDYAVGGRYPDYNEIPEMEETRQHYDLAIQVYGLVKERIDFIK